MPIAFKSRANKRQAPLYNDVAPDTTQDTQQPHLSKRGRARINQAADLSSPSSMTIRLACHAAMGLHTADVRYTCFPGSSTSTSPWVEYETRTHEFCRHLGS